MAVEAARRRPDGGSHQSPIRGVIRISPEAPKPTGERRMYSLRGINPLNVDLFKCPNL